MSNPVEVIYDKDPDVVVYEKTDPTLFVTLDWESIADYGADVDLDLVAYLLDGQGKIATGSPGYFVFYNNPRSLDGSTQFTGDDRGGRKARGKANGETISVKLGAINDAVDKIVFAVSIFKADLLHESFANIAAGHIAVENELGRELYHCEIKDRFDGYSTLEVFSIARETDWRPQGIERPFDGGLIELGERFGLHSRKDNSWHARRR